MNETETLEASELIKKVTEFFSNQQKRILSIEELRQSQTAFESLKKLPFDVQQDKKSEFEPVMESLFRGLRFYVEKRWWKNKDKKGDVDFVAFFKLPSKEVEAFVLEVSTSAGDSEKMQKLWSRTIEIGEKFKIIAYPVFGTLRTLKHHLDLGMFSSKHYPPGGIRLLTIDILEDLFRSSFKQDVPFEKIVDYIHCQEVSEWTPNGFLRFERAYPLFMPSEDRNELTRLFKE